MMGAGPTRTGAAAGHDGYYHEAVCYDSDEHFLAIVVPFLTGGVAAGEPTIATLGEHNADLVRAALPAGSGVTFLAGGDTYARPAAAIRSYRRMMSGYVAGGAGQIRIVGELPAASLGPTWDSWARYESAINHAYQEFPLWTMCAYDVRRTPEAVLADVARTHPRTARPDDRHEANRAYLDPAGFLNDWRPVPPDPLQLGSPRVDLGDPTPAAARQAVRDAAAGVLSVGQLDDLVIAVSETVTNAGRHGRPPVRFRVWAGTARVVVSVSDRGAGPTDPFAGLLAANAGGIGGLGLWISYQACDQVALSRDDDGFTVRLTAGDLDADI